MLKTLADADGLIIRAPFAPGREPGHACRVLTVATLNKSSTTFIKI